MFWFYVSRRKIDVKRNDILVSDSVNVYPCIFQFSEDWKGLNKHIVFKTKEKTIEVLLGGEPTCNIPWELLTKPKLELLVGVYGTQGEELILNTVWKSLGKIEEGPQTNNESGQEPTPDELAQLLAMIGSMEDLYTQEKDTIVQSINEVYTDVSNKVDKTGGTVTGPILFAENVPVMSYTFEDEQIQHYVEDGQKGVTISENGLSKNSVGPFEIYSESKEINFGEETKLTGVVGDTDDFTSVPNMGQLAEVLDKVPVPMTAEELREILTEK